jgi:ABC-type branched-subunit amino acid transport system ATPase component/ABC-type branched-subunit amino acid transport system permease subunit
MLQRDVRGLVLDEGGVTENRRIWTLTGWAACIAAFYLAIQLIWPTPIGIVVWGLVISSFTALLAFGLVLIYRSHRVINFAQADLGAVPASLCVALVVLRGWSYWLAVPIALLAAVALGSAVEFLVIRRFSRAPRLILMVATIGLAQLLAGIGTAIPGLFDAAIPPQVLPAPFGFRFEIRPFIFHAPELVAVVATVVVTGLLYAFLRYTHVGVALRASASSADRASLLGVNVGRLHNVAWVIATVIATIAMIVRAGMIGLPVGTAFGPQILLRALAAAVIGRMENLAVTFAAACGIGVLEVAILWNEGSATLIDPALFVLVLVALLLQRRNRESPVDDESISTWAHAAIVRPVPRVLARLPEVRWVQRGLRLLFVVVLFALPALLDERYTNLAAAVVIYAIIAVSLVLLTGWGGEISLGQVAFVAIGAAAAGAVNVHWHLAPVPSLVLAGLVGAAASIVIGLPALRIRGLFLSVTSLAFAVATSSYLLNHDYFSFLPEAIYDRIERRPLWTPFGSVAIDSERRFYYVAAVGLILVLLAVRGLQRSRVERDVVATRDNERTAQVFGLSPARAKLLAFALSGFFASFAGGLLVLHQQALGQQIFAPVESLRALTMVVVGGLGSVAGAIVGAVFVKSTEWFNVIAPVRFRRFVTFSGSGIGLLIVLWLLPGGFGSVLYRARDAWLRFVARRRGIVVPALVTDVGVSRSPILRPVRVRFRAPRLASNQAAPARSGLLAASDSVPVALAFRDVDVAYGQLQVLFGATVEVRRGETVALLGTNGAGKSTMLRTASGLLSPYHGSVWFEGADISGLPPHKVAALGLVHVPGGRSVFPSLTVAENLRIGSWTRRRDRGYVCEATARVLDLFPSLRDRLDDPAATLSGGQQQMLTIAMSLLLEPRVMMIDELSLGLSPLVVEQLLEVVRRLQEQGITMIVVEQSLNTALSTADRAYFLEKGTVRFRGPTADLLDRPDLLRSIFLEGAPPLPSSARVEIREPAFADRGRALLVGTALSKRFAGVTAVDGVSFELREGEILGMIGPNGAGKTTVFDLVSGFLVPDTGEVRLADRDLTGVRPQDRARLGLARSFQNARLFGSLTAHQAICVALDQELRLWDPVAAGLNLPNVAEAERRLGARADELIDNMGLGDFRDKFVAELSTGSRRILDLACQIGASPLVILLDEPSAGIAQRETEALGPMLQRVRDLTGASLLVIEHDLPLILSVADRIVALDLGRVVCDGDPDRVINDPHVVESYLGPNWHATGVSTPRYTSSIDAGSLFGARVPARTWVGAPSGRR